MGDVQYLEGLLKKTHAVRETTEDSCKIDAVERYATSFNSWLHHAPVPTRPIWETALFESSVLAGASFFLAVHGFYEEACAVLRAVLDGFLTGLYWDTQHKNGKLKEWKENGRSTNEYWRWESGEEKNYPRPEEIWRVLLAEEYIRKYDERYQLEKEVTGILRVLHKYVHGRPQSRHYSGAHRSSLINAEFKRKDFDEWFEHLKAVYRLVSVLSILQYPELLKTKHGQDFAVLEPEAAARVKNILDAAPAPTEQTPGH